MATREDRKETSAITYFKNAPQTQRSLSGRKGPTPIMIPSNKTRGQNPLQGRLGSNLNAKRYSNPDRGKSSIHTTYGNVEPPTKRQKLDTSECGASGGVRGKAGSTSHSTTVPNYTLIDLSSDDEDLGTPLRRHSYSSISSPDPIALIPDQAAPGGPSHNATEQTSHRPAPDGPDTKRLKERMAQNRHSETVQDRYVTDSDPIESASEFHLSQAPEDGTVPGFVKATIAKLDGMSNNVKATESKVPHLDLKKMKNNMKPKDPTKKLTLGKLDPLIESTLHPPKAPSQKALKPSDVPIMTLILGTECFADARFVLSFEEDSSQGKIVVKDGKMSFLDVMTVNINRVQLSKSNDSGECILVLWTRYAVLSRPNREAEHFISDITNPTRIAFKFDIASVSWNSVWSGIVQYFKKVMIANASEFSCLDAHGSRVVWAQITHESNHTITSYSAASTKQSEPPLPLPSDPERIEKPRSDSSAVRTTKAISNLAQPVASTSNGPTLRRSLRRSAPTTPSSTRNTTPEDSDELILVYPPTGTGAVNITRGDINRLKPGQYLNDTLIEFGLKLWLNDLRQENEELAEQIHVFSSFFYKKLNTRNKEEGYKSVSKWTQKFDIFKKKYIIIPINEHLHWYLAIIYHPEYTLSPPPSSLLQVVQEKPCTRKRKRELNLITEQFRPEVAGQRMSSELVPDSCPPSPMQHARTSKHDEDEKEVEEMVNEVARSCSISDALDSQKPISPSRNDKGKGKERMSVDLIQSPPSPMDLDQESVDTAKSSAGSDDTIELHNEDEALDTGIPPARFYASTGNMKQKMEPEPFPLQLEVDYEKEKEPDVDVDTSPYDPSQPAATWIFTFDSLGGSHPAATRNLREYLRFEASHKKSITDVTPPCEKKALVPTQNNYCDCGLFLLHFAKKFMRDPEGCFKTIQTTTKAEAKVEKRNKDWDGDVVDSYREDLTRRIYELQQVWKTEKEKSANLEPEAERPGVVAVDDSDDEIIIEDVLPARTSANMGRKGAKVGGGSNRRGRVSDSPRTVKKPALGANRLRG